MTLFLTHPSSGRYSQRLQATQISDSRLPDINALKVDSRRAKAERGALAKALFVSWSFVYINFGEEAESSIAEKQESEETEHEQKTEALELKLAAGVLFGLTDVTSDVTLKLDAEVEF